ncbi:MAG: DUF998 domain-containing protein [Saprospiraceae bacterium]|nr:DUF998 domain-containing protein [Saprospiraceae bacterium]
MRLGRKLVGVIGLSSVVILIAALITFGFSNNEFSFFDDFISKLGALGQPNAIWFNLTAFVLVEILLIVFGFCYGRLLNNQLLSILLSLFGLGFSFTAISTDMNIPNSHYSKAHMVSICLGLAFWLFGLSRLGSNPMLQKKIRMRANFTAIALVLSMAGFGLGLWSMPITHRLVFGIVFGWTAVTSIELIFNKQVTANLNSTS